MPVDAGYGEVQSLPVQAQSEACDPMTLVLKARQLRAEELHRLLVTGIGRIAALIVTPYAMPIDYI